MYGVPNSLADNYSSLPNETWIGGGFSHIDLSRENPFMTHSGRSPAMVAERADQARTTAGARAEAMTGAQAASIILAGLGILDLPRAAAAGLLMP